MRYFYIVFSHESGDGHILLSLETYPSLSGLIKTINEQDPELNQITITNILELTKEDFESLNQ